MAEQQQNWLQLNYLLMHYDKAFSVIQRRRPYPIFLALFEYLFK